MNERITQRPLLPLIALGLDVVPFAAVVLLQNLGYALSYIRLLALITPIAGLVLGVESLRRGKARVGTAGVVIAAVAVALPIAAVLFVVIFFVGAYTGIISLM